MTEAERLRSEVARLGAALKRANDQAEHFEREWYLLGDELEALKKAISEAEPVVWANPNGGFLSDTYINQFATGLEKQTHTIPLYTLKGIK